MITRRHFMLTALAAGTIAAIPLTVAHSRLKLRPYQQTMIDWARYPDRTMWVARAGKSIVLLDRHHRVQALYHLKQLNQ